MKFDIFDKSSGYFYANDYAALAAWYGYATLGRGIVRTVRFNVSKIAFGYVAASGIGNELKTVRATKKDKQKIRKLLKTYNPRQEFIVVDLYGYSHMETDQPLWFYYDQLIGEIVESGAYVSFDFLAMDSFVTLAAHAEDDLTHRVNWYMPALKVTKNFAAHWADITCEKMVEVGITDRRTGVLICRCLPDKKDQVLEILESSDIEYETDTQKDRVDDILATMKDDGLILDENKGDWKIWGNSEPPTLKDDD